MIRRLVAGLLAVVGVGLPGSASADVQRTALIAYGTPITVVDERGEVVWQGPEGRWPAWSPDAARLAFTTPATGGLAVADLATGDVTPVEGFTGVAHAPEWSPDGSQIAFTGVADPSGHREVFVAPADGCCAEQVTGFPAAGAGALAPRWTRDGQRLVVGAELDSLEDDIGDELFVVDVDTGTTTKITGQVPGDTMLHDLSPVDDTVVVVVLGRGQRLWRVGVDGSGAKPLGAVGGIVPIPAWSPDGRWIGLLDGDGVAVLRPDGTGRRLVSDVPGPPVTGPSWFPDGRRIAYVGLGRDGGVLLTVGLHQGVTRVVGTDAGDGHPAVSPVFVPVG